MQGGRPERITQAALVAVARELLVAGGPDAVVVREVARRLGVTAPALYRHVQGREDLLTLLIAACTDEATDAVEAALEDCDQDDAEQQLRVATLAFRAWARANPAEFALLYGTPIPGYAAPLDGPTVPASLRFGATFGRVFVALLRAGRLRSVPDAQLPEGLRRSLQEAAQRIGLPMGPGEAYPFLVGWQRMLGLVSVEVTGHLRWAVGEDSDAFVRLQLDALAADLLLPAAPLTSAAPPARARRS